MPIIDYKMLQSSSLDTAVRVWWEYYYKSLRILLSWYIDILIVGNKIHKNNLNQKLYSDRQKSGGWKN